MIDDLDRLILDADPAQNLSTPAPNPAQARRDQVQHRTPSPRAAGVIGLVLSVAVVIAVVAAVAGVGRHAGAPVAQHTAGDPRRVGGLSAQALPSRHYCSRRGGTLDVPCGAHPRQGFVRVSVNSEVLVDARFAAPVAVDSRHRFYEATFRLTRSRGCDTGSFLSPSLNRIDVGQRVTLQAFVPLSCAGTVRVIVRYVPDFRTALTTAVLPPGTRVLGRSSVTIR